jgi:hypothetical protein
VRVVRGIAPAFVLAMALVARPATAQSAAPAPSLRAHHITVSGGLTWTGGYPIGDATAVLRGNAVGPSAPPFTLFAAESSVDAAPGVDARFGYGLSRSLAIEVGVTYERPGITTALSADAEAAPVTIEAERLSQYVVDASLVWQLPRLSFGRARPFVIAGGGYLRQLYQDRTLVETGSVYYGGGGVRYWLRGGDGIRRSIGLRGDALARWRVDGVEFEDRARVAPVLRALAYVEF